MHNFNEHPRVVNYNSRDKEQFKRRMHSILEHINNLFDRRSRLLVIRLDLGYGKYYKDVTVDGTLADIAKLRDNIRFNSLLSNGYLGFIRKLEQTQEKGLHHHMLFLYDGRLRNKGEWLAQKLGEYWVEVITTCKGSYWNCNAETNSYRYNGIGMVERDDSDKRHHLIWDVAYYLAKVEQIPLNSEGRRLFDCCLT